MQDPTRSLRLAALLGALALSAAAPARAFWLQSEAAAASADLASAVERPLVWAGRRGALGRAPVVADEQVGYGGSDETEVRRTPHAQADGLRAEWARLNLAAQVEGPSAELQRQRNALWFRAADAGSYPGQWELLIEMAAGRALELARAGELGEALRASRELLPPARLAAAVDEYELVPAPDAFVEAEQRALQAPRLIALRDGWRRQGMARATPVTAQEGGIEAVIRRQVAEAQRGNVVQFGVRAVPVLAKMLGESHGTLPDRYDQDPAYYLVRLAEHGGLEILAQEIPGGDYLLAKRAVRALDAAYTNDASQLKYVDRTTAPRLRDPRWVALLEVLFARPDVAPDCVPLIAWLTERDLLSPGLARALGQALAGDDPALRSAARAALENARGRSTAVPALEAGLQSTDADTRTFAALGLTEEAHNAALRARRDDPDPRVRLAVAMALRAGPLGRPSFFDNGTFSWKSDSQFVRELGPEDAGDLEHLLQDSDEAVLTQVLVDLIESPQLEVSTARLLELAKNPSASVRLVLMRMKRDGLPLPELCEIFAASKDVKELAGVDHYLSEVAKRSFELIREQPEHPLVRAGLDAYLPALELRMANGALPVGVAWAELRGSGLLPRALSTPAGVHAVIASATRSRDREWHAKVYGALARLDDRETAGGGLAALRPGEVGPWLDSLWSLLSGASNFDELMRIPADARRDVIGWLDDPGRSLELFLRAAALTSDLADDAWRRAYLAGLARAAWPAKDEDRRYRDLLLYVSRRHPQGEGRRDLLGLVLECPNLPDWSLEVIAKDLAYDLQPELAERVLRRWGANPSASASVLVTALQDLRVSPEQPLLELLAQLVRFPHEDVSAAAVQALGRLHHPAYLPLLEEGLRDGYAGSAPERWSQQKLAAEALAGYLSDDAAEILLRGAGWTSDASVREACFAGLETIRRFQDETARWAGRRSAEEARAVAVRDLVALLDDKESAVRVQALRSLATLQAVEELPRLVRLLKDADAKVRAAAQAALEVLNARGN